MLRQNHAPNLVASNCMYRPCCSAICMCCGSIERVKWRQSRVLLCAVRGKESKESFRRRAFYTFRRIDSHHPEVHPTPFIRVTLTAQSSHSY